jgi:uncharacterized RDD family membrane protein YckC
MLLCLRGLVEELIEGSPMHPARSFRKRFGEIGTPAQAHPKLLRSANRPMAQDLLLARIGQAAAMSAREYRCAAQVKRRHAPTAGSALAAVIDVAVVAVVLVAIQSVTGVSFLSISRDDPSRIGAARTLPDSVDGVNLSVNISFTTEGTLAFLVLVVGYLSLAESGCKASLGMYLTGIRVIATQATCIGIGRALWRNCAKIVACATVIGALLAAFSARRQGLHDYAARTVVVVWKRYLGSRA